MYPPPSKIVGVKHLEKICLEGPEDFDFGELGVVMGRSIFPAGRQRIFGENEKNAQSQH